MRAAKEAGLAPELAADCGLPYVTCMVKLPSGSRISCRFLLSDSVQHLFDFVDSRTGGEGAGGAGPADPDPGTYQLVSQFPRRVFRPDSGSCLAEVGLGVGQEAFFVEELKVEQAATPNAL